VCKRKFLHSVAALVRDEWRITMSTLTNAQVNKAMNQLARKKRKGKQFLVGFEKGFIHGFMWCMGEQGPYSDNLQSVIQATHSLIAANELKLVSVPKNLAFLIPEILARLAIAGRARTLPVPPVGRPVRRREKDVWNA
jgi:hypothetical protein